MADVFISYRTSDRPRAEVLKRWFEDCGWTVWMDREARVGESWSQEIEVELRAAKVVVVLWGAEARRSDWVIREATIALETDRLIQILATGLPLLEPFDRLQAVRFESWTGEDGHSDKSRLLQAVASRLGAEPPRLPEVPSTNFLQEVDLDRFSLVELVLNYCTLHLRWRRYASSGGSTDALLNELRSTFSEILRLMTAYTGAGELSISEDPLHPMVGEFLDELERLTPLRGLLT